MGHHLNLAVQPVTKAIFLNFLKLRMHSYERILLEKDGNIIEFPDNNEVVLTNNFIEPDFKLDVDEAP